MARELQAMAALFERDPGSLVFLELGEELRRMGRLESGVRVALTGLEWHPSLAEAHDLYARILVDIGDLDRAREVWMRVLERHPRHVGALKGLGFLSFWDGDVDTALDRLESALGVDPTDYTVVQALMTVRAAVEASEPASEELSVDSVFGGFEGADEGMLLVSDRGRVLGGRLRGHDSEDVSEEAAAYLSGAAQEAERTSRMLGLGAWRWMVAEAGDGNVHVSSPDPETLLLVVRDRSVPAGRLAVVAERAGHAARSWLEASRP